MEPCIIQQQSSWFGMLRCFQSRPLTYSTLPHTHCNIPSSTGQSSFDLLHKNQQSPAGCRFNQQTSNQQTSKAASATPQLQQLFTESQTDSSASDTWVSTRQACSYTRTRSHTCQQPHTKHHGMCQVHQAKIGGEGINDTATGTSWLGSMTADADTGTTATG